MDSKDTLHQPQRAQEQPKSSLRIHSTETAGLLVIEDGGSKTSFKKYVMLLMLITVVIVIGIMYVYVDNTIYGIPLTGTFLLFIIVDAVIFPETSKMKVVVDKKHNSLRLFKNKKEQYVSDYPLSKIKSIKTSLTNDYYLLTRFNRTALIAVLDNNQEETLIYSGSLGPFYIDIEANKQARIGRKIAEFLGVPFREEPSLPII
jgi:hypothetical protein